MLSKKSVINLYSEALAEELLKTAITVTVLAPRPVSTEFIQVAGFKGSNFKKQFVSSMDVARYGYNEMMRGHVVALHSLKFQVLVQGLRLMPRALIRRVVSAVNAQFAR